LLPGLGVKTHRNSSGARDARGEVRGDRRGNLHLPSPVQGLQAAHACLSIHPLFSTAHMQTEEGRLDQKAGDFHWFLMLHPKQILSCCPLLPWISVHRAYRAGSTGSPPQKG